MTRRMIALITAVALVVGLGLTSVEPASAAPDPDTARIDMKVLVVTNDTTYPSHESWIALLEREGVPYDVFVQETGVTELSYADLADAGANHAYYQGVVCATRCTDNLGFGSPSMTDLEAFLVDFDLRLIHAYAFPDPIFGLSNVTGGNKDGDVLTVGAAATTFDYLVGTVTIDPGTFGYYPSITDPVAYTPWITESGGSPVLGVHADPLGYDEMVMTVDTGPFQVHTYALGHGMLDWLTDGRYLGYHRNYFAAHFDDIFLEDDRWDMDSNTTPEPSPNPIRMVPADVDHALAWQTSTGIRLDLVFNGAGADERIAADGSDPLTDALLAVKDQFYWINHTYTHLNLDPPVDQATIEYEIAENIAFAARNGITIDPTEVVTGEHSGLGNDIFGIAPNPNLGPALTATGIEWVAADNSVQPVQAAWGSALSVPRYPANVFYNTATEEEQLDEYNYLYNINQGCVPSDVTTCNDRDLTWEEYVDAEASIMLPHMISNDPRPHYFHQSDLTEDRIFYTVFGEALDRYTATFATPLVQPTMAESGRIMARTNAWDTAKASVTAYIENGAMYLSSPTAIAAPLTGVDFPGATSYGGQLSGWIDIGPTPTVLDWTAPEITVLGDDPVSLLVGQTYTDPGATAIDNVDGDLTSAIQVDTSNVDTTTPGTYTVTYNVADAAGNAATEKTRGVEVVPDGVPPSQTIDTPASGADVTAPVQLVGTASDNASVTGVDITITNPDGDWWNGSGWQDTEAAVAATLASPGTTFTGYSYSFDPGTPTSAPTTYQWSAQAVDASGNRGTASTSEFAIIDVVAPVITLDGANPQTIEALTPYVELGATATDDVDGDLTASIVIDATDVDTTKVGTYQVTYDVDDLSGNPAVTVTRTVEVVDTTIPTITLIGDDPQVIVEGGSYVEQGATATDIYDGDLTGKIVIDATDVDTTTVGTYEVTYDVTDSSGNPAVTMTRTVEVVDTTAPTIALIGSGVVDVAVGTSYSDSGATAFDAYDGDLTGAIVTMSTVDTTTVGTYEVTYDVTDSSGNAAVQVRRTVIVFEPPVTGPTVDRMFGSDRYATAAAVAMRQFERGVDAVFLTTGVSFPDALVAAAPGGDQGWPILLAQRDTIPKATLLALDHLSPSKIYIVGGTSVVSAAVESTLSTRADVIRLAGPNRYATAVAVSRHFHPDPDEVDTVFVVTGLNHADAVVAAAPAGRDGAPILLVPGDDLPPSVADEIARLTPDRIIVVGGTSVVTSEVVLELAETATVIRLAGADRFGTSAAVVSYLYPDAGDVDSMYLATAWVFPDALVSGPPAGRDGAPVMLVPKDVLPPSVAAAIDRLEPEFVHIIGGPAAISDAVADAVDW